MLGLRVVAMVKGNGLDDLAVPMMSKEYVKLTADQFRELIGVIPELVGMIRGVTGTYQRCRSPNLIV